ncbi:hypothetical protein PsYK624_162130 [Phanerochaete sordida]|uniref:Uncharacterized protein n=1 Tax=Phanerochaete sordida TaxID=48140 RepID=A0A9P3GR18_9APHY|nr:hypothetical protein PsYK624_162130 [Phanerochaete sordida]
MKIRAGDRETVSVYTRHDCSTSVLLAAPARRGDSQQELSLHHRPPRNVSMVAHLTTPRRFDEQYNNVWVYTPSIPFVHVLSAMFGANGTLLKFSRGTCDIPSTGAY